MAYVGSSWNYESQALARLFFPFLSLSLSCCTHDQSGDEYIVYTLYIHGTCCILNSGNVLFVVRSNIL